MTTKNRDACPAPEKLPQWAETDLFVKEMCQADLVYRQAVCRVKTEAEVQRLKEYALFKTGDPFKEK